MTDGWKGGRDPIQRWLRVVTTITVLGVFVYLAINQTDPDRRGTEVLVTLALALGAVLTLLGYERLIRLPMIGRQEDEERDRDGD